ncbi:hypothetical protein [Nonlabens sp. Asnod2-A12]|uniref:hypothetical protein n=1 Tax=Nonlabens sp. Asnod2-A12 TaxID=3160578 RepID=UPI003866C44D
MEPSSSYTDFNFIFSNLNDGFVQVYQVGTFTAIAVFLIIIFIKIKRQSYQDYVISNNSVNDKELSYLTKDILMQPRTFEHELENSSKGISKPNFYYKKYFTNRFYFFAVLALICYLLIRDIIS